MFEFMAVEKLSVCVKLQNSSD